MSRENLDTLRESIDRIDRRIIELLNERMVAAAAIGSIKALHSRDVIDTAREEAILQRLLSLSQGPLPEKTLRAIYREIFSGSRALQYPLTIAFLGPQGTYSHEAALDRFGDSVSFLPCHTVADVFQEVAQGAVSFGVVPVENSIEGSVRETLDLLMTSPVNVCGEIPLKIVHALMNRSGRLEDIRTIASHPQALAQCRQWLMGRFPGIPLLETSSTAQAANKATEDPSVAAIANERLALIVGLRIIRRGIQDKASNITRFLLLGDVRPTATGSDRTSVIFWTEDKPGALYRILERFARHGINLSRIESRPDRGDMPWKYAFFVDLEGHREDPTIQDCLKELSGRDAVIKILGSFPRSQVPTADSQSSKAATDGQKGGRRRRNSMAEEKAMGRQIAEDVRAGMDDCGLKAKYALSDEGLRHALRTLVDTGLLTDMDLYQRTSLSESACYRAFTPEAEEVLSCPRCGKRLPPDEMECNSCQSFVPEIEDELSTHILDSPNLLFLVPEQQGKPSSKTRAFLKAASKGRNDFIANALSEGVSVDVSSENGNTALIRACFKGNLDTARLLLERGANANVRNNQQNTPLIFACNASQLPAAELLLERGADPNVRNEDGNTALLIACARADSALVRSLLKRGADADVPNKDGDTPLMKACEKGRLDVAEQLLNAGANINAKNRYGNTALMKAALKSHAEVVKLLVRSGALVNVTNSFGNTALMKACHGGDLRSVRLLLDAGADETIRDKSGETAYTRALKAGKSDVAELLQNYNSAPSQSV